MFPLRLRVYYYPLIPQIKGKKVRYILLVALVVFAMIRFSVILDGVKLLTNALFRLSEETQSYEYVYFTTTGTSAVEAVLAISLLAGFLCCLWGSAVNYSCSATTYLRNSDKINEKNEPAIFTRWARSFHPA